MTQDEIIRMAREVDAITGLIGRWIFLDAAHLERFAALVAAHEKKFWMEQIEVECNEAVLAERELCAKVCEELDKHFDYTIAARQCAAAIRARNNND